MKRGQILIRGTGADGNTQAQVDAFDLSEESFRSLVLELLTQGGQRFGTKVEVDGPDVPYEHKSWAARRVIRETKAGLAGATSVGKTDAVGVQTSAAVKEQLGKATTETTEHA